MANTLKSSNKDVTTAGTAVQLNSSVTGVTDLLIKAKSANTGVIYIGDSSVDSSSYQLAAGELISVGDIMNNGTDQSLDVAALWIDSSVNGEGVEYTWIEVS